MHRLVELLFVNPMVTVAEATRRLDVTYPTARSDIDKLQALGIVRELESSYPKAFYSAAIIEAAYHEDDAPRA